MPQPDRRILALVDGSAVARDRVETRVLAAVTASWGSFDGWYRPELVDEVVSEVVAAVGVGQMGVAQLTDAYLAQVATIVRARAVGAVGVASDMSKTRRLGVSAAEVHARAAAEYRWQVSQDVDPPRARDLAVARAEAMTSTDLGLAYRDQSHRFMRVTGAARYRRVIRPERSRSGTCGLCVAASNRIYTRETLMPLHNRCKCAVVEVGASVDEGRIINDAEYAAVAAEADSLHARDLVKVRVKVHENGELGPVLTNAAHAFRGPSQIAA